MNNREKKRYRLLALDLDMMAWAGRGVAVANAPEDVRAQADEVTASNDEDGVGHWIRRYLERRKS